jgi:YidC/Oxa1 family membrane protein insertase
MNEVKPKSDGSFHGKYGLSDKLIEQAAHAKVFGAPISAAFNSSAKLLDQLNGNATTVKVVAALMIVTMGATTFLTQKQMMARSGAPADPQQAQVQKIMLYVLPLSFAVFGFSFPIGVLLYWLTTNVWSMGQQRYVIARMPPVVPGSAPAAKGKDKGKDKDRDKELPAAAPPPKPKPAPAPAPRPGNQGGAKRVAGTRKNKQRKGGRR